MRQRREDVTPWASSRGAGASPAMGGGGLGLDTARVEPPGHPGAAPRSQTPCRHRAAPRAPSLARTGQRPGAPPRGASARGRGPLSIASSRWHPGSMAVAPQGLPPTRRLLALLALRSPSLTPRTSADTSSKGRGVRGTSQRQERVKALAHHWEGHWRAEASVPARRARPHPPGDKKVWRYQAHGGGEGPHGTRGALREPRTGFGCVGTLRLVLAGDRFGWLGV